MKTTFHLLFLLFISQSLYAQCLAPNGIGSFEGIEPLDAWFLGHEDNGQFQTRVKKGSNALRVDVTAYSGWKVRMFSKPDCNFDLKQGESYTVSFRMRGPLGAEVSISLMDNPTNMTVENLVLDTDRWATYSIPITAIATTAEGRLKINFKSAGRYFADDIVLARNTTDWYVSPSGTDDLTDGNGTSTSQALQSIQYAVNTAWEPGDTIFVMDGTYRNANYGTGNRNNNAVLNLSGANKTGEATGWLVIKNAPGHQPKLQFDGAGGIIGNQMEYLDISGFEIEGPNQAINFNEAMANRLVQEKYFAGRGIAIWSGHHINIHHNKIHDCPNSGIRINNGDYCSVDDNEVYNNTWWSSNAESAIVFATAKDIDTQAIIKMSMTNNLVYDNYNNIPYYNSTYSGATSDYGTAAQDYIIDGSGCYVTRNKDTYFYGWFYFANNICYGNGINGLVVHKTDRSIVTNNTCYMNGAVPLSAGRQKASGITVNSSDDVQIYNNISWPRNDDDYGYKVYNWDQSLNLQASHNILAKGLSDLSAGQFTFVDPLFSDAANVDFSLQAASPAIDAGLGHANLPLLDFSGAPRGTAYPDIGALEAAFGSGTRLAKTEITGEQLLSIYPNPTAEWVNFDKEVEYSVFDSQGRLLFADAGQAFSLAAFEAGVYWIFVEGKAYRVFKY